VSKYPQAVEALLDAIEAPADTRERVSQYLLASSIQTYDPLYALAGGYASLSLLI